MKISRRMSWGVGIAALTVALVTLALRPESVAVDLAVVASGPLTVTIEEDGTTRFRNHVTVGAPVTGRLLAIPLRPGDSVERGQVVARLAPAPLDERTRAQGEAALAAATAARAEAQAQVEQAGILLDQARRDRSRTDRLGAAGAVAPRAVEDAVAAERIRERDLETAQAVLERSIQQQRQAGLALLGASGSGRAASVEVRSPLSGRVLRVMEEHERVLIAGTPLLQVGSPDLVEIEVDVLSSDAPRIRPGGRMVVRGTDGPDREARVTRIEPAAFTHVSPLGIEEQRVNVIGRFLEPPVGFGDGFRVEVSIELWNSPSALQVPPTSLVPTGEGWGVYVAANGRAQLRQVELGHQSATAVEVLSGLHAGELIVLHPDERIRDGTRLVER